MPFTFLRRESDFEMVWDWEVKLLVKRFSWILIRRDFWGPGNGDWGLSWLGVNPHQINIFFLVGCIADILLQLAWPRPLIWVCVMDNSHYLDECTLFPFFRLEYLLKLLWGCVWIFLFFGCRQAHSSYFLVLHLSPNIILAPPGVILAIPNFYWSSKTHFFRSHQFSITTLSQGYFQPLN